MQVCRWLMGASDIDFQTHKTFSANLFFAERTSLKYKKIDIFRHCLNIAGKAENWKLFWDKTENYFIIKSLRNLRLFLLAVVEGPSFACRLMCSGIYAQAEVSEWI